MMADSVEDSKILVPFLPSLSQLSSVKVALSLFQDFGGVKSNMMFAGVLSKEPYIKIYEKEGDFKITKKDLSFIPNLLRKKVMHAIEGLNYSAQYWKWYHSHTSGFQDAIFTYYWRSNGSVDTIKTIQRLIQDEDIKVLKRYVIAGLYCLEESLHTCWSELETSGRKCFRKVINPMEQFWTKWNPHQTRAIFGRGTVQCSKTHVDCPYLDFSMCVSYIPVERTRNYVFHFGITESYDFFQYLCTKNDEGKLRYTNPLDILRLYLHWPLQSLFLDVADKVLNYLTGVDYKILLRDILDKSKIFTHFDYCELFEMLWNKSPNHLKNAVTETNLKRDIDFSLNKMKQKRKLIFIELINLKHVRNSDNKRKKKSTRENRKKLKNH